MSSLVRTNAIVGAQSRLSANVDIAKLAIGQDSGVFLNEIKDETGITISYDYVAYNGCKITISLHPYFIIECNNCIKHIEKYKDEIDIEFIDRLRKSIYE